MLLYYVVAALIPGCFTLSEILQRQTRIVNGQTIKRGDWSFLVSLHYLKPFPFTQKTHMKHLCGGALVHPQWVVTAAHCIGFFEELSDVDSWNVVLGEHNQYLHDVGEQTVKPEQFFIHPGFKPHENKNLKHDIALIKLSHPANMTTNYVESVPMSNDSVPIFTKCTVGGWGQVSSEPYGWGMYIPLKTSLYIVSLEMCANIYSSIDYQIGEIHMVVDETVMCAGIPPARQSIIQRTEGGTNDACNGDSGSPLLCPTGPDGDMEFVGVVSAGKGCGTGKYPGIYTKVSHYNSWLNNVINNN